jgi:hypothetical protein
MYSARIRIIVPDEFSNLTHVLDVHQFTRPILTFSLQPSAVFIKLDRVATSYRHTSYHSYPHVRPNFEPRLALVLSEKTTPSFIPHTTAHKYGFGYTHTHNHRLNLVALIVLRGPVK